MKKLKLDSTHSIIKLLSSVKLKNKELETLGVDLLELCVFKENKLKEGDLDLAAKYRRMEKDKIEEIVKILKTMGILKKTQ
ncbi:MAG: hypothetical protein WC777_03315 [Candidatus Gracilibacteria bacterium]|jgi:hypothetical protein